jgi:hypothetical protein
MDLDIDLDPRREDFLRGRLVAVLVPSPNRITAVVRAELSARDGSLRGSVGRGALLDWKPDHILLPLVNRLNLLAVGELPRLKLETGRGRGVADRTEDQGAE